MKYRLSMLTAGRNIYGLLFLWHETLTGATAPGDAALFFVCNVLQNL